MEPRTIHFSINFKQKIQRLSGIHPKDQMWSGPNHRWQSQNDEVTKVMFLAFDKKEHDLKILTCKRKMKENNFSEKMASANKPTPCRT